LHSLNTPCLRKGNTSYSTLKEKKTHIVTEFYSVDLPTGAVFTKNLATQAAVMLPAESVELLMAIIAITSRRIGHPAKGSVIQINYEFICIKMEL
jgi:hypothetical protein